MNGADGATVSDTQLTLTFKSAGGITEYLDESSVPVGSDFTVTVAGAARSVSNVDVDGATVTLTLASAVGYAETVTVGYTPGTNSLKDLWDHAVVQFSGRTVRNDSSVPGLTIGDRSVAENDGTVEFTVTLDRASGQTVTVDYATSDDSAEGGTDYTAASGTLSFAPGDVSKTFSVSVTDDSVAEGSETFNVTLSNPSGATIIDNTATATITDDEQTPTLTIADARETEGVSLSFTVSITPASDEVVTVGYATADRTATADTNHADGADYTAPAANATLSIPAGQTSATITISTGDTNLVFEPDETFTVTLSSPSANAVLGTAKTATGTIENDDVASTDASLASLQAKVNGSALTLTPTFESGTYSYTVNDPVANTDDSLTIEASATDDGATIAISGDDDTASPNEPVVDLTFGVNTLTVTVTAEDGVTEQVYTLVVTRALPKVGWRSDSSFLLEGAGEIELGVELEPASDQVVSVDYAASSSPGGALAGEDYVAASGTLTFSAGETEKIVRVTILDDNIFEPNTASNNFQLTLSNPNGAELSSQLHFVMVRDNDSAPTASMQDVTVDEDEGTMTFVLSLSHAVEAEVTYNTDRFGVRGTAVSGTDYEQFYDPFIVVTMSISR